MHIFIAFVRSLQKSRFLLTKIFIISTELNDFKNIIYSNTIYNHLCTFTQC